MVHCTGFFPYFFLQGQPKLRGTSSIPSSYDVSPQGLRGLGCGAIDFFLIFEFFFFCLVHFLNPDFAGPVAIRYITLLTPVAHGVDLDFSSPYTIIPAQL